MSTDTQDKDPMFALYKNHEAAARKEMKVEAPSKLEWCKTCGSPVSNWQEHTQRQGCIRNE